MTANETHVTRRQQELEMVERTLRVLIIDDRRDASFPMQRLLELDGHEVRAAADGASGLDLAREFKPQVVLCDIGLPGPMSGYDVARLLRAEEALSAAYLAAVTGYGCDDDRRQALEAGFDCHLTKPVGLAELRQVMCSGVTRGAE